MADPRLNSMHLEDPRRQDYRRAREALLHARGYQTLAAEQKDLDALRGGPDTIDAEVAPEDAPGLRFWLVDRDSIYPLKVGLNTIGRSPDNDIVVQDCYVSRRHCAILVHATAGCELHDTASKNGTFLNGRKLSAPSRLVSGDELRMCDRQLVFCCKATDPDSPIDSPTLME